MHTYNVQCRYGHVWAVPADSDLGKKAQARELRGLLSAMPVSCNVCEDCEVEAQIASRGLFVDAYTLD